MARNPRRHRLAAGLVLGVLGALPCGGAIVPLGPPMGLGPLDLGLGASGLAVAPDGTFLLVGESFDQATDDFDVRARRYSADGQLSPAGALQLNGDALHYDEFTRSAAALAGGGFIVAWHSEAPSRPAVRSATSAEFEPGFVAVRRLDALGQPSGPEVRVSPQGVQSFGAAVAALADGGFAVAYREYPTLVLRRYDASGAAVGGVIELDTESRFSGAGGLAASADGSLRSVWTNDTNGVRARRVSAAGVPDSTLTVSDQQLASAPRVATAPTGEFVVVWVTNATADGTTGPRQLRARIFDAQGDPVSPAQLVRDAGSDFIGSVDVAMDEAGTFLVVWDEFGSQQPYGADAYAQFFDAAGVALEPPRPLAHADSAGQTHPLAGYQGDGTWLVAWTEDEEAFAQRFGDGCGSDTRLCLQGRFLVEVDWRTPAGATGAGRSLELTEDTGAFWFFGPDNLELVVKILDGRGLNGHFWVFWGGLSNVEFELRVLDLETGERRSYVNPQGSLASRADTRAFLDDGAQNRVSLSAAAAAPAGGGCASGAAALCLRGQRFVASIEFVDPRTGQSATAQAVQLTPESGYFWFFGPENVELALKLLDGTAINGRFWVFYGSLTDVEFTLRVVDTATGEARTYRNPQGTLASRADTAAF